eukprot:gnl/MRDRNA2_/MRDRNA2_32781_c0_seq1.p1 gnl/MRDRNA2_/MRDRNA2_32781_c0~~gnl/MRDRNA2_/MRDRNA2_32781_c0_seq1.p1  ORF type:complete len:221 (-),score=37.63 gnl/MRDRNA2_/MRDRNA2_32781_c0_seq1:65-727(-)
MLGPVPKVGAHEFRHPLSARETFDPVPLTDRPSKRPPVPRTQRPQKLKPSCGAIAREAKKFGNEPSCLRVNERTRPRSIDGRIGGGNVMQQYFGRKNAYDRELCDPGNQVFEWGPSRTVREKDCNHARAATLDKERQISGGRAPWADAQQMDPAANLKCHGRANTIMKEMRVHEQAKKEEDGSLEMCKAAGRQNRLANELKGPQQLAGDPVDSFARLGMY